MTRTKRARAKDFGGISALHWAVMTDSIDAEIEAAASPFDLLELEDDSFGSLLHNIWKIHGGQVIAAWLKDRPGTRPSPWWAFDAPRQPIGTHLGCWWDGKVMEPRLRLDGVGAARHDALNYVLAYRLGLPRDGFLDAEELATWPGAGEALDPNDPPLFESQAAYLGRNGLLVPGKVERLPKGVFQPERIDPSRMQGSP